jgi:2,3-diaminopropionate biosynthesis protein SbnB
MSARNLLVIDGPTVMNLLAGREHDVVAAVRAAYLAHAAGQTVLPHSLFLRFPSRPQNRIISLPAYLGGDWDIAGLKWIASFPGNAATGLDRASAILILNSAETGQPYAILEGSQVSAKRTAASAALAAKYLLIGTTPICISVIGCGLIGFEVLSFVRRLTGQVESVVLYDIIEARARHFAIKCAPLLGGIPLEIAPDMPSALRKSGLVVFATTAAVPHIMDASLFKRGAVVLHVSLRDLSPEVILACDNVVDDPDHVCRAGTSVHRAEQLQGGRGFIRATLAELISGAVLARRASNEVVVFSPFGLGLLDLAVGHMLVEAATETGRGLQLPSFLPKPWYEGPERMEGAGRRAFAGP